MLHRIILAALGFVFSLEAADPFLALHRDLERRVEESLEAFERAPAQPVVLEAMTAPASGPALPDGLPAAVIRVESNFNPWARSPKGARGLWQLMPETARRFGLRVDARADERVDPQRSARAAVRYLQFLHGLFGDWKLALAAYNAGENRVIRAMERGRTRDFYELARRRLLPEETRQYVPAVLAHWMEGENPHE